MKKTDNYSLPQWEKQDFIKMEDFNDLTQKTDAALKANADATATGLNAETAARGEAGYGITAEELQRFPLSPAAISERFPSLSSDLLTVLQQVSDSIEALGKNFSQENKKS